MSTAIGTVGVIGAGRMGRPIIGHLARTGLAVAVYDVDEGTRETVTAAGGAWTASLEQLARQSEIVLVCVGYDQDVRDLLLRHGLLRDVARGTIVAVLSTVHPRTVRELADAARPLGVHVIDSTVCRGGRAADEGTLLSFVGGDPAIVERFRPVAACYSADVVHTGGIGTAQIAKAANNLVMWACLVANHEALALAHRLGADADRLREALLTSSAENYALRHWGEHTMAWADDDLAIVQAMAQEAGISLPQAGVNRELCRTLKPKRFRLDEYGV